MLKYEYGEFMRFVSTRDNTHEVSFKQAVLDCMPCDGGLYVPSDNSEDLRRWILYADENTSFASLAGSLTSALINKEFSPIICETIASKAFPIDPVLKKLDDNLFLMELYNGPTGTFKDYGVSYLASVLETILTMDGEKSILLDATSGELGACMAKALRGKHLLKSVLVAPKGKLRSLEEEDFVWNGGNIYPIEVDGTVEDCHNLVRKIFSERSLVEKYHLTVANTANIGRLLPQAFFYTYAFSHLKKLVTGDMYYALGAGNYGTLVSGLYGWRLALPVNGFIVPSSPELLRDTMGNCVVPDSIVPLNDRNATDPSEPSNIERLEHVFKVNSLILKSFVYPAELKNEDVDNACKELFVKYNVFADKDLASAYAAALMRKETTKRDDGSVVLISRTSPALDKDFVKHNTGEVLELGSKLSGAFKPVTLGRKAIAPEDIESLISVLNSLNLLRLF